MTKKNPTIVRGVLAQVSSQRTPYKPYGYSLSFDGQAGQTLVMVELALPSENVVEFDLAKNLVVVDLNGLNAILEITADSLEILDQHYKERIGY